MISAALTTCGLTAITYHLTSSIFSDTGCNNWAIKKEASASFFLSIIFEEINDKFIDSSYSHSMVAGGLEEIS